ncbi:putative methyltransferase [Terriglobus roseus DSM 18391]|uniref:Putative methyltransferase n=1 Tax=Terriglobus roseus (strain DSM 18391 / NRRL B-41598 / KBS 63) TaxID=926566 RepID=I3ZBR1_TERRK|nr:L-histidine N(alpha)-methyltransferase [Terriglobus roseus]AFL86679.1 putative methyltransferase [Terriglobus roseus DSM 18391]
MSTSIATSEITEASLASPVNEAVAQPVQEGLSATPKWLPAWLFYDAQGSRLFERITHLPEYYLTRTERAIFTGYADGIIAAAIDAYATAGGTGKGRLRLLELGAGSATKTGILLAAAVRLQDETEYLPIDVSETAMEDACASIARALTGVVVQPQVANYVTDELSIPPHDGPTLALYIGSSIGNFAPHEAVAILQNLRAQMRPGDTLLLGTDLVKDAATLISAYNDHDGVTAAFNLNVLRRINRDLRANFDLASFTHQAIWNAEQSRMEMHLQSTKEQTVRVGALRTSFQFDAGETIHTENSYKFTKDAIRNLFTQSGFQAAHQWTDEDQLFAVTVASAA